MATALKSPAQFLEDYDGVIIFERRPGQPRNTLYEQVCRAYPDHSKIEQDEEGNVYLMPPGGGESGWQDTEVGAQLRNWARHKGNGKAFGATTTFKFPNGSLREPDASWASNEKVYGIPYEQRMERIPIVPEFIIEIVSKTDNDEKLQTKMHWYIDNGVELGWLIHPKLREVKIYTKADVATLRDINKLRGMGPVKGFVLDLEPVWRGLGDEPKPRPVRKKR